MRWLLAVLLCVCAVPGLLGAGDAGWVPELDEPGLIGPNGEWPVVMLPAERKSAVRLVHAWNAQVALRQQAAGSPTWHVPTIAELYGAAGVNGRDPNPDPSIRQWRVINEHPHPYLDLDAGTLHALQFDLRRMPARYPNATILVVPGAGLQLPMQRFIDASWQADGHAGPPRPQFHHDHGVHVQEALEKIGAASGVAQLGWANYVMIGVGLLLLYLGIARGFEPLLLVPIAIGCILVNAAGAAMAEPPGDQGAGGLLWYLTEFGIVTGLFPLLIFLGVGALTDFGPLLANPWSALLGAAAQVGIFGSFFLAVACGDWLDFTLADAAAIAIIGGADGPTSIYVASMLAPDKLGAIAVAAYSYMALVPIIQPPIMRALTTREEREIMMSQAKPVSQRARILFPIVVILLCILLLPAAVPLIGMLMFGNLLRECGVTERLSKTAQNELINLVTIALGLAVGTKLAAEHFLSLQTVGILVLGCLAFMLGTAAGVLFGKMMCVFSGGRINPLIGAAGVSAVPMAARVAHMEGQRANKRSHLLMHAMGPNVAGVIGSAVAAGILIALLG